MHLQLGSRACNWARDLEQYQGHPSSRMVMHFPSLPPLLVQTIAIEDKGSTQGQYWIPTICALILDLLFFFYFILFSFHPIKELESPWLVGVQSGVSSSNDRQLTVFCSYHCIGWAYTLDLVCCNGDGEGTILMQWDNVLMVLSMAILWFFFFFFFREWLKYREI